MFVLFFLVHIFFAGAFFLLNAYVEAGGFVLLGIISLFLFGPFRFWSASGQSEDQKDAASQLDNIRSKLKEQTISFFKRGIFPLSVGLFYIAIFGIVWSLSGTLHIALSAFAHDLAIVVSLLLIVAFFTPLREKSILLELGRANILVLSLLEWGMLVNHLFSAEIPSFHLIIAVFILIAAIVVTFIEEYRRSAAFSHSFLLFFFIFVYLFSTLLFLSGSWFEEGIWVYCMMAIVLWTGFFEIVSNKIFRECRIFVRLFSILFVYAWTIGLIGLYTFWLVGQGVIVLLLLSFFFNVYVHQRFENYLSLLFCLLVPIAIFERIFGISENFFLTLISWGVLSFGLVFGSFMLKSSHKFDEYFFQATAIIAALIHFAAFGIVYGMMGLLYFSILLLFFSALLFVSYLRIAK